MKYDKEILDLYHEIQQSQEMINFIKEDLNEKTKKLFQLIMLQMKERSR